MFVSVLYASSVVVGQAFHTHLTNDHSAMSLLQINAQQIMQSHDPDPAVQIMSKPDAAVQIMSKLKTDKGAGREYNLTDPSAESSSQFGQDLTLWDILSKIKDGFFLESGAFDGEINSNTLQLETKLGWTGLLVEPSPEAFATLESKNRKAVLFNGALSTTGNVEMLTFHQGGYEGQGGGLENDIPGTGFPVLAAPLLEVLEAAQPQEQHVIDFWSLDIEGSEGKVLQFTDFSKIEIGILLIEMNKSDENNNLVRQVMQENGFKDLGSTDNIDNLFVNPNYFSKRNLPVPEKAR